MTKYKSYSSQSAWRAHNQFLAMKDFFGDDRALWHSLTTGDPYRMAALSTRDNKTGMWVDMYYLATDDSYKVDYTTAMTIYKKYYDKVNEMRKREGVPIVYCADGFNRTTMVECMLPLAMKLVGAPTENNDILNKIRADVHMMINRFDGCWLTSPMPTIACRKETDSGEPRLSYTFGKKIPEKNRLAFHVYVVTHADDYMI